MSETTTSAAGPSGAANDSRERGGERPLRDAFGTRIEPSALLRGLDRVGATFAKLRATDDGFELGCPDPDPRRDDVARGLTFLRSRLSPLVPLRAVHEREIPSPDGARFVDARARGELLVALAELSDPGELGAALDDLIRRTPGAPTVSVPTHAEPPGDPLVGPRTVDATLAGVVRQLATMLPERLSAAGRPTARATVSVLSATPQGMRASGPLVDAATSSSGASGPHLLVWFRPGAARGVRPALIVAMAKELRALERLVRALAEDGPAPPRDLGLHDELLLDGIAWRAARRPTVAARPDASAPSPESPIRVDPSRCIDCGVCAAVCPTGYLGPRGLPAVSDPAVCIRCYECVDACPTDALRPVQADDTHLREDALAHRPGWLSRLAGAPGPTFPAPFPPSYLMPRVSPVDARRPRYVLGLAVMTQMEHAAVLVKDGVIVGAIEHERLVRIRHAGWTPPGRPGTTVAVDPTLCIEEALCRRPIRALLEAEGITLDDVDVLAFNGLHGRFVSQIDFTDGRVPLPKMRAGRLHYLPHHLCHAASAFRPAGAESAWVLTVDGRGDRESATVFRAEGGRIEAVDTLLALADRSVGGVYEGVTRLLGFGSHGQGSVMALASFGAPTYDMRPFLSVDESGEPVIHEIGIDAAFASLRRAPDEPLERRHQDLAASLQAALESTATKLLARSAGDGPLDALCLGGGVTLNCKMNERLRRTFEPRTIFAQAGANDAGTAFGAALEAWVDASGDATVAKMEHAYLGPSFSDDEIEAELRRAGLRYRRSPDVTKEAARLLVDGRILCWFQGRMEFGPRALGGRSIVADPRDPSIKDRVNGVKSRETWRPFGPSILAGHEAEWFERGFDARFMLFTLPVREDKRALVPAVVHVDGTTRPQSVHAEHAPEWHALISEFHRLTGVPMVVNTSFNRRGEPIVCTPKDAVESFLGLGADVLAIGPFLVEPVAAERAPIPPDEALRALPGGRRLSLRLTTRCDLDCGHCTLRDQHEEPDRDDEAALRSLVAGREAGCDELVILRGEATLSRSLPSLVARAKAIGYRFVQLQTNGVALASPAVREPLLRAGVDAFEVMLLAAEEPLHDELTNTRGTFRATLAAITALAQAQSQSQSPGAGSRQLLVTIPVLRRNMKSLPAIVTLARRLGARRVQFNFPRPVELPDRVLTESVPRLAQAAQHVAVAARLAAQLGLGVSTEALPHCHLPPELRHAPDSTEDWKRHRIDDLHLVHESLAEVRRTQRPEAAPCRSCAARDRCPKTWALYLELFGTGELVPFVE